MLLQLANPPFQRLDLFLIDIRSAEQVSEEHGYPDDEEQWQDKYQESDADLHLALGRTRLTTTASGGVLGPSLKRTVQHPQNACIRT
ncbi:hypothetical protein [Halodesulfurarchaeum sp.]|uniref:hypothetical protein n=1 Tax=Halodesulfurarchaeum sp. TaxID=1980530 RepID=UPI002FC3394F